MSRFRRLTLWQEMATPHLLPLLTALAPRFERVRLITLGEMHGARASIGWNETYFPEVERIHAPSPADRSAVLQQSANEGELNLLQGLKPVRWQWQVQRALICSPAAIVVMSELHWPGSSAMRQMALATRERILAKFWGRRAYSLLAFSEEAAHHYIKFGVPMTKVHPFAYTPRLSDARPQPWAARKPTLMVAAQLAPYKGIDLLFQALALIKEKDWRLRLAGEGPMRRELEALAVPLGIADRIEWLGWQPASAIPQLLADANLMILPSRYEGWGAVVNEALGVGTPVVVSRGAGAHCLVQSPVLGETTPAGDVDALATAIVRQLGFPSNQRRPAIRRWSRRALSPEVAADYFMECLEGSKPLPPWRAVSDEFS